MLHSTTVSPIASPAWPQWWKTVGMTTTVKIGESKLVAFLVPSNLDLDSIARILSTGDSIAYGGEKLDIISVYKPGFDFDMPPLHGSVKPGILIIGYKAVTGDPYTLQAQAIASVLGLRLVDIVNIADAILPAPSIKPSDKPAKDVVVQPVGEGLPDTINQFTQLLVVGGLVVLGVLAFKRFAR